MLLLLTFDSCFNDENEYEIETPVCVSVDKSSDYETKLKIWETQEFEFEILNECNSNYTIIDYTISSEIKNVRIEGLSKNTKIESKKLPFKVVISPISIGNKTIGFNVITDIGQIYVSVGVTVTY
ncbi:hypothetical protein [Polaribacter ponticola]|uniref:Uncharacterized protein n=1 Tax=Polaribacter ponticola TaxID=2978475 RepID=A0ABT5S7D3_9FLAO|nr:hypothetical protein [Polaribacter sp. MSW5]MDD7914006.1 hypothetical protein [Polaribacter sp. MSW5]